MDVQEREYLEALQKACGFIEEAKARFAACRDKFRCASDAEAYEFEEQLGGGASWLHYAFLAEDELSSSLR